MITNPIYFQSLRAMNDFYNQFEHQAIAICRKYNVMDLWDNPNIQKDQQNFSLAIISLGASAKGSNRDKAINEIIDTFNGMFN